MNELDSAFKDITEEKNSSLVLYWEYSRQVADNFSDEEIKLFEQAWRGDNWSYDIVYNRHLEWEIDNLYNFQYRFNWKYDTADFWFFTDNFFRLSKQKSFKNMVKTVLEKRTEKWLTREIYIWFAFYHISKKYWFYSYNSWRVNFLRLWRKISKDPKLLEEFESILSNFVHSEIYDWRYNNVYNFLSKIESCSWKVFLDIGNSNCKALWKILNIDWLDLVWLDLVSHENELNTFDSNKVKLVRWDARYMPFARESFDFINFSYVFFHHSEMSCKKKLLEASRALKEWGYIFIQPIKKTFYSNEPIDEIMVLKKVDWKLVRQKIS